MNESPKAWLWLALITWICMREDVLADSETLVDYESMRIGDDKAAFGSPEIYGLLNDSDSSMMDSLLESILISHAKEIEENLNHFRIFWVNLWQKDGQTILSSDNSSDIGLRNVHSFAQKIFCLTHQPCNESTMEAFGLIFNPVLGNETQPYHIDYTLDYTSVWIPLTSFINENALQYITVPDNCNNKMFFDKLMNETYKSNNLTTMKDAVHDIYVDLIKKECGYYVLNQIICDKYLIIKLNERTIHRGIPNRGTFTRMAFWIDATNINAKNDGKYFESAFIDFEYLPPTDCQTDGKDTNQ